MKDKQLGLDVKSTYWWVMAYLLTDDSDTKIWPATETVPKYRQCCPLLH